MGIDPNNHKLHQGFPRPCHVFGAGTSSCDESMNKDHKLSFTKEFEDDQETTIIINNSSSSLNLDLTIALPSPNRVVVVDDKTIPNCDESRTTRDMDIDLNC